MNKIYRRKGKVKAFRYIAYGQTPEWFDKKLNTFEYIDGINWKNTSYIGKKVLEPGDYILVNSNSSLFVFSSESFESQFEEV